MTHLTGRNITILTALGLCLGTPSGRAEPMERFVILRGESALETEYVRDASPDGQFSSYGASLEGGPFAEVIFDSSLDPASLPERFLTSSEIRASSSDGEYWLNFAGRPAHSHWFGGVIFTPLVSATLQSLDGDPDAMRHLLIDIEQFSICEIDGPCARVELSDSFTGTINYPDPG